MHSTRTLKHLWGIMVILTATAGLCGPSCAGGKNLLDEKRVNLDLPPAELVEVVSALSDQTGLPISIERKFPARNTKPTRVKVRLADLTLRAALDKLAQDTGTHVWKHTQNPLRITLAPRGTLQDKDWIPNRRCPAFELTNASIADAVKAVSNHVFPKGGKTIAALMGGSVVLTPGERREDNPIIKFCMSRVTTSIKEGTVEEALDQIAAAIGDAWWSYAEIEGRDSSFVAFFPIHPNTLPVPPAPDDEPR